MDSETLIILGFGAPVLMLLLAAPAVLQGDTALKTLARLALAVVVLALVAGFILVGNLNF